MMAKTKSKAVIKAKGTVTTRTGKYKTNSKFKIWMGVLVVVLVAVVGVAVVRLSQASNWCTQVPSDQKLITCYYAFDADGSTPWIDVVGEVVQDPAASEYYALNSAAVGNAIWISPNSDQPGTYSNVNGNTINACFRMQGKNGSADVILVMKYQGTVIAQKATTVDSSGYSDYCVDQVFNHDTIQAARFEVYLVSGEVKVDAVKITKSPPTYTTPPPDPVSVSKYINVTAQQQPKGVIVSQDGVNGAPCIMTSGFKGDGIKRCEVNNAQPLQINDSGNYFGTANGNGKFEVCLAALGGGGKPVPIHLSSGQNATSSKTVNAVFGTEGLAGLQACATVDLKDYPVKLFKIQPTEGANFGMTSFTVKKL